jgi:predicted O-methyltransferase YrrM
MKSTAHISRRTWLAGAIGLPAAATAGAALSLWWQRRGSRALSAPISGSEPERRVLDVIADYDRSQRAGSLSIGLADGRLLRILAESTAATRIVEIGTSFGYSGLWLALALRSTTGRLTTFEIDPERQARARQNFERAGVLPSIDLVLGDAHQLVTSVRGPVDMVFSDADKEGYLDYLQKLMPALRPGGLFVTHNLDMASSEYLRAIATDPALESTVLNVGSGELAVTLKKRA